jgi:hypothetical protein
MEVCNQLHVPAALPPANSPWYPLDRRLDGAKGLPGRCGEDKNLLPLPEIEPLRFDSFSKGCHLDVVRGPSTPNDPESDAGGSLSSWQGH